MSMTDPIADLLTRIRNAHLAKHDRLDVPSSNLKAEVCRILKEQGYISKLELLEAGGRKVLRIYLRYTQSGDPAIRHLQRVSRPGRRVYRDAGITTLRVDPAGETLADRIETLGRIIEIVKQVSEEPVGAKAGV